MNYIFYYPKGNGAPSSVSKNILDYLLQSDLPYNLSILPANKELGNKLKLQYPEANIISLKEMLSYNGKSLIVHIPVSPVMLPNKKFFVYLISILKNTKLVINYHGEPRSEYKIRFNNYSIKEILLSLSTYIATPFFVHSADVIVLNSYRMKDTFVKLYNPKKIEVIPNALSNTWFDVSGINKINFNKDEISLFYHGRLSPEKGVDLLLEALHNFYSMNSVTRPVTLYIAGDGEQRHNLLQLAEKLKVKDHVVFLGKIPLNDLKSYLVSVDAAIYPSLYEPFSLAVLESFALVNGPVLYSNEIGINDFVNELDFDFCTFAPTIQEITKIINNVYDDKIDTTIFNDQKNMSQQLSWNKVIKQYINLYYTLNNLN
jgi:glycosyltransferase involved in cell wall biosynthesis